MRKNYDFFILGAIILAVAGAYADNADVNQWGDLKAAISGISVLL